VRDGCLKRAAEGTSSSAPAGRLSSCRPWEWIALGPDRIGSDRIWSWEARWERTEQKERADNCRSSATAGTRDAWSPWYRSKQGCRWRVSSSQGDDYMPELHLLRVGDGFMVLAMATNRGEVMKRCDLVLSLLLDVYATYLPPATPVRNPHRNENSNVRPSTYLHNRLDDREVNRT
jgi:hypothetical protein